MLCLCYASAVYVMLGFAVVYWLVLVYIKDVLFRSCMDVLWAAQRIILVSNIENILLYPQNYSICYHTNMLFFLLDENGFRKWCP